MKKRQTTYPFTVDVGGKAYSCERTVVGTRVLTQSVRVSGIGSENDAANYGPSDHPVASMEGVAKLIAQSIIAKAANAS